MGALTFPAGCIVYADTQIFIYSVERHPTYQPLLQSVWREASSETIQVVTSELTLLETLVIPLRSGNFALEQSFEQALLASDTKLFPINQNILRRAAYLRGSIPALRTPDALHAATALVHGCSLFLTNDPGFRRIPGLVVQVLDDLLTSS